MMAEALCELLPWGSTFFGRRVARTNEERIDPTLLDTIRVWCAEQQVECLYFLADPVCAVLPDAPIKTRVFTLILISRVLCAMPFKPPGSKKAAPAIRKVTSYISGFMGGSTRNRSLRSSLLF